MTPPERPVLSDITVLAVDDHRDSVHLLIAALEPFGAAVMAAGSAPEARELLRATDVDIIVCDLELPGENGLEFIRRVRSRLSTGQVPAIAVTFFPERFGCARRAPPASTCTCASRSIRPTSSASSPRW